MNHTHRTLSVDSNACIGCGICTSVCPFGVLIMEEGRPRLDPDKHCLKCLHCAAACPREAILFGGERASVAAAELAETAGSSEAAGRTGRAGLTGLSPEFVSQLAVHLSGRRSYRHFTGDPVDRRLLEEAAALADFAPSAKNQHPAGWIIVNSREKAREIMELVLSYVRETGVSPEILSEYESGNNVVMGTASTLILGYCRDTAVNPPVDTALALSVMELYLQARGVGTCWAGYLTRLANASPDLRRLLNLPEGSLFYGALMAGYPSEESYLRVPVRTKPAPVTWL
ncbi:nitroreductase family protein [Bacilliculturomica massiliensis]|uniref:nitroreductase family protein n=1 Tax=Bacilliculturomica massiliensis TaxID=1917867 RepID=UPI0013EF3E16|nr:nitroreductase family protein [Bacilliculturomica massiliensis]